MLCRISPDSGPVSRPPVRVPITCHVGVSRDSEGWGPARRRRSEHTPVDDQSPRDASIRYKGTRFYYFSQYIFNRSFRLLRTAILRPQPSVVHSSVIRQIFHFQQRQVPISVVSWPFLTLWIVLLTMDTRDRSRFHSFRLPYYLFVGVIVYTHKSYPLQIDQSFCQTRRINAQPYV